MVLSFTFRIVLICFKMNRHLSVIYYIIIVGFLLQPLHLQRRTPTQFPPLQTESSRLRAVRLQASFLRPPPAILVYFRGEPQLISNKPIDYTWTCRRIKENITLSPFASWELMDILICFKCICIAFIYSVCTAYTFSQSITLILFVFTQYLSWYY